MRWRHERWVKLYTNEAGSFAQLPLYVRGLGAMLLKIADPETGRIDLAGKEPWQAIAFQLGADASDRRLLRKHIPMLVADGYLEVDGADLFVRNFTLAQTGVDRVRVEYPATEPQTGRDSITNETRLVNESAMNRAPAGDEPCTTEELSPQNQNYIFCRSEKKREEERENASDFRSVRIGLAKAARGRLNKIRACVAERHQLIGVQSLPSQIEEVIQVRLAEFGDDVELARQVLDGVLACLEAEADEKRSVAKLSASSFQSPRWQALCAETPRDARDRVKTHLAAVARDERRAPARASPTSSIADEVEWLPNRNEESA